MQISIIQGIIPAINNALPFILIVAGALGMFIAIITDEIEGSGKLFLCGLCVMLLGSLYRFFANGGSIVL